ncbi:hypothetical protein GF361_03860 [Candidatus Woesearchaeota archaeon]|nr:hypothetical protein [Candidatus Woesearchaeota archaeon]
MNKKAQGLSIRTIILMVIGLVVLFGMLYLWWPTQEKGKEISSLAPSSTIICSQKIGVVTPDIDKDGLDDDCDNCVCEQGCKNAEYDFTNPLKPTITDPRDDKDKDGLPDTCDEDDSNPSIVSWSDACKDNIVKSGSGKGRCIIS